jgi:hypothetical protein
MAQLFSIETSTFRLDWQEIHRRQRESRAGYFHVRSLNGLCQLRDSSWKAGPPELKSRFDVLTGPALLEETEYHIHLRAAPEVRTIRLIHRDPQLIRPLASPEANRVLLATVNFRGQVGRTTFTVVADGIPQLQLELEVLPTKLDYETDYRALIADLQLHARSLVLEYLRATYSFGSRTVTQRQTHLEWLLILRDCMDSLEKAIAHVTASPRRRLVQTRQLLRAERIRRPDSAVRSELRRGAGAGPLIHTPGGPVRQQIMASPHVATLNTPEHQWLRTRLEFIQRQLSLLIRAAEGPDRSERQTAVLEELTDFRRRVARMLRAEPLTAADSGQQTPVLSLQLLQAPGYREATQACQALRLGLTLEGDAVRLSVKDLSTLYENWVFIEVLRVIESIAGRQTRRRSGLRLEQAGISLCLAQGREQVAGFQLDGDRSIEVIYNPQFQNQTAILIPQRPDILIRISQPGWPSVQIIIDAKYRVETGPDYRRQFGTAGPPVDAINVLHRYRDAVLEQHSTESGGSAIRRSVVYAAAVFPGSPEVCQNFRSSRLWEALSRLGIGAIPALPHDRSLLEDWLRRILRESGWEVAQRVVSHTAELQQRNWHRASLDPVLVSVLDSRDAASRFSWLQTQKCCYIKLPVRPHRHFRVAQVAFYCPRPLEKVAGIAWVADVQDLTIVPRSEIATPWTPRQSPDQSMILYQLGPLRRLPRTLIQTDPHETSFRNDRWTTRLALERAANATEIALETTAEWQLYEGLKARGIPFRLRLDAIARDDDHPPRGRVWFLLETGQRIKYHGAEGFLATAGQMEIPYSLEDLLEQADEWKRKKAE